MEQRWSYERQPLNVVLMLLLLLLLLLCGPFSSFGLDYFHVPLLSL